MAEASHRTCPTCRAAKLVASVENRRYVESGLDNVVLHGIEVSRCRNCGEELIAIPRVEQLHRTIAADLIRKPGRLGPEEIRFLRKWLGWSGADFAKFMGVDRATVSRWERREKPQAMGGTAERLLRLAVAHGRPVEEYPLDTLAKIDERGDTRALINLRATRSGWIASA